MWTSIPRPKRKRRGKLSITADILEISREGILKTQIMYKANLSFAQLNHYTTYLLDRELIAPAICEGREGYVATARGLRFLQKYGELVQLLKEIELRKSSDKSFSKKT